MNSEYVKGKPLSKDETKALLQLIERSRIITTKTTNATNNKLKLEEWTRIADEFNATATTCRRTPQQLRLKWENLKKNSRKRSTMIRMNNIQTGGGAATYIPPDEILDRVSSLLGSTASGFTVLYGGDKDPEGFVGGGTSDCGDGDGGGDEFVAGDARVDLNMGPMELQADPICTISLDKDVEPDVVTLQTPSKITFASYITPNKPAGKRKFKGSERNRSNRNTAIADYYILKKKCMEAQLASTSLDNEKKELENQKLKLENKKLQLEIERLKSQMASGGQSTPMR